MTAFLKTLLAIVRNSKCFCQLNDQLPIQLITNFDCVIGMCEFGLHPVSLPKASYRYLLIEIWCYTLFPLMKRPMSANFFLWSVPFSEAAKFTDTIVS